MSSRSERDDYKYDVMYDVWRAGGNPDAVDYDRCDAAYDRGVDAEDHAGRLLREAAERREQREFERRESDEEAYYRELEQREQEP